MGYQALLFCSDEKLARFDAKETIVKACGSDFDPRVVEAFLTCFQLRVMDIPEMMV
jgi:hypothetical protein